MILLAALLAFLFSITVYLLFLAAVNRRPGPVVISGGWDAVGLVFAFSGFLLVGGPAILIRFYYKDIFAGLGDEEPVEVNVLLKKWWLVWVIYYGLAILGAALLIWVRKNKTVIYNVDADQFENLFPHLVASHGYRAVYNSGRWLIAPVVLTAAPDPNQAIQELGVDGRGAARPFPLRSEDVQGVVAEVEVGGFAPLCNVVLHWKHGAKQIQANFEKGIRQEVRLGGAADNPAGNWFLGLASLLVGVLLLLTLVVVLTLLMPRKW